jgi:formylglycine-generating enzyme
LSPIENRQGRWKGRALALAAACACVLLACEQLIGLSKLEEGPGPRSTDGGGEDAALDGGDGGEDGGPPDPCTNGKIDGDETDEDCGGSCGKCAKGKKCKEHKDCAKACEAGLCAGCGGVELSGNGGACIDPHEVTVAEYESFSVLGPKDFGPRDRCSGRISHPADLLEQLQKSPVLPVRRVVWCSAYAFCKFQGKRLCGNLDGGAMAPSSSASDDAGQWMAACGGQSQAAYPYGDNFEPSRCNDESKQDGPWDPDSGPDCKTLVIDLFDLSGNVAEWEDACADAGRDSGSTGVLCRVRGGSFKSPADAVRCDALRLQNAATGSDDVGFRCCE